MIEKQLFAEVLGGHICLFFEKVGKGSGIEEVEHIGNFSNGHGGSQERFGAICLFFQNVLLQGNSKCFLKKVGKVTVVRIYESGKVFDADFFVDMVVYVSEYAGKSVDIVFGFDGVYAFEEVRENKFQSAVGGDL